MFRNCELRVSAWRSKLRNRSVVKLRLQEDTHGILHLTSIEELLAAGNARYSLGTEDRLMLMICGIRPPRVNALHGGLGLHNHPASLSYVMGVLR